MARYSPLPSVSIDPRNEAELVQQAAQRVYEASNQTLNDFSAGNPLAALLEGQAFAQGELLFWANQLPDKILLEWIGPFLGAMRRLGTPAIAQLQATLPPSENVIIIPANAAFTTNANLTGGETVSFRATKETVIPPGVTEVLIDVTSQYVGAQYNVPANTITGVSSNISSNIVVTNPRPAVGGSDVESYNDVQERFFTLIRRKNPVSAEDWSAFFIDLYGVGTLTSVQPNRPSVHPYNYIDDYLRPNGQVSFFVLGPGGVELTPAQLRAGQNVINFSTPIELEAHLYPITLSQVQYDLKVEIEANGTYGGDTQMASLDFRNRLNLVLQPGNYFPADMDPTVSEVDSVFYSTFPASDRFVNPGIVSSLAYNTPATLSVDNATFTQVYTFNPSDNLLNVNDLVYVNKPVTTYYSVVRDFSPTSIDLKKQTIPGNLELKQINFLRPGIFSQGDVVYWSQDDQGDAELHVILQNIIINSTSEIPGYVANGQISGPRGYTPWRVNTSYVSTPDGIFNPDLVRYEYGPDEFQPLPPNDKDPVPLEKRPGGFAWLVAKNFTLEQPTDDLKNASTAGVLSQQPVTPRVLTRGNTYEAGTWVMTPQVGSGPNPVADPYYNYVDLTLGVVNKYAYVRTKFTYAPNPRQKVSEYFDDLVNQNILREIVAQSADNGLPTYQYRARFETGAYLEYRETSRSSPEYYIAAQYFTPTSRSPKELVKEGLMYPLAPDETQKNALNLALVNKTVKKPVRMFTFFRGDRTYLREGSLVTSYTATESVSPLFAFRIYEENGVFVKTETLQDVFFQTADYVPLFDPEYAKYAEDSIYDPSTGNIYRVTRAFTPKKTTVNWTNTEVVNTPRCEEYAGNLLRYVSSYNCEEPILSQLGKVTSAIRLGCARITVVPKNKKDVSNSRENLEYLWEPSASYGEAPELSWFTGTRYTQTPPEYGDGTLAL